MNRNNSDNTLKRNVGKGLAASTSHASSATQKMSKNSKKTNERTRNMKPLSNITNVGKKRTVLDANLCDRNDARENVVKRNLGRAASSATQNMSNKERQRENMRKPFRSKFDFMTRSTLSNITNEVRGGSREKSLIHITVPPIPSYIKDENIFRFALSSPHFAYVDRSNNGFYLLVSDKSHPHFYSEIGPLGKDGDGRDIAIPSSCNYRPSKRGDGRNKKSYFPANFTMRELDNVFVKINESSGWVIEERRGFTGTVMSTKYVGEAIITHDGGHVQYMMRMVLILSEMKRPVILTAYPFEGPDTPRDHWVDLDQYVYDLKVAVTNSSKNSAIGVTGAELKDSKLDVSRPTATNQDQKKPTSQEEKSSHDSSQKPLQQNEDDSNEESTMKVKTAKTEEEDDDEVIYVKTVIHIDDDEDDEVIFLIDDFKNLNLEDSDDEDEVQFVRTVIVL